jgi:hypothetical protein
VRFTGGLERSAQNQELLTNWDKRADLRSQRKEDDLVFPS